MSSAAPSSSSSLVAAVAPLLPAADVDHTTDRLVHRNFIDAYGTDATMNDDDDATNEEKKDTGSDVNMKVDTTIATIGSAAPSSSSSSSAASSSSSDLLTYINSSIIGRHSLISTPFGLRRTVYADYTASGKPLSFIEDYVRSTVLPSYANTHTSSNYTGLQTTLMRAEARDIVKRCVRGSKDDGVLFVGSGTTAAISLLIHLLNIAPHAAPASSSSSSCAPSLVVILGPYEHHANSLVWTEAGALVHTVCEDALRGGVDLAALSALAASLHAAYPNATRIGAFSACSNVTGITTDTLAVTRVLKTHGFLAVWDYASSAPYSEMDMNPGSDPLQSKDAMYFSPHKFVGGPSSSGILVLKKSLCKSTRPLVCGGGTVFFVAPDRRRYLENMEEREEGGTPDIVGCIRSGLVLQLKESVGVATIAQRESEIASKVLGRLAQMRNVVVLGNPRAERLPIVSMLIKFNPESASSSSSSSTPSSSSSSSPSFGFLHSNFVSQLLNDLFGVQSRSGCMCAGPYAHVLLGLSEATSLRFEQALMHKYELLRPGFTRVNFNWFVPLQEVDFILSAIEFVSEHGWRFLPLYHCLPDSGEWKHRSRMRKGLDGRKWIGSVDYSSGRMKYDGLRSASSGVATEDTRPDQIVFAEVLAHASSLLASLLQPRSPLYLGLHSTPSSDGFALPAAYADLRWFPLPSEALLWVREPAKAREAQKDCIAIRPKDYGIGENEEMTMKIDESSSSSSSSLSVAAAISPLQSNASTTVPASFLPIASSLSSSSLTPSTSSIAAPSSSSSTIAAPSSSSTSGHKRPVPSSTPSLSSESNRQKKEAKKQRKIDARSASSSSASSIASSTQSSSLAADATDDDASMLPPSLLASSSSVAVVPAINKRIAAEPNPEARENVCKNCWHVHNALSSDSSSSASASSSSSSTIVRVDTAECTHCPCIANAPSLRRSAKEVAASASKIQRHVGRAIADYSMIQDGDRILIGISGGKDSLTLFHMLRALQRKAPISFTIGCVTVDPQTPEFDPSPLKAYFASQNVPYFYESYPILALAREKMTQAKQSICAFCSRMKRGILYSCLRREKFNVLALGQHLDDLAESLLMSVFHNGTLRTMKANYHVDAGDIRIIRPLLYVRERMTREYATVADLPVINENCPACFEAPKERQRIKLLLAGQEQLHPTLFSNILKSMTPLLGMENHRYQPPTAAGAVTAADASSSSSSLSAADVALIAALTPTASAASSSSSSSSRGGNSNGNVDMGEYDDDDATIDALCRTPGGACALPTKQGKGTNK